MTSSSDVFLAFRHQTILYIFVFICIIPCCSSKRVINNTSPLSWTAVSSGDWKLAALDAETKRYWEVEWAQAEFDEDCDPDRQKFVRVVHWPGERVDLPCRMCQWSSVFNGLPKRWMRTRDEDVSVFIEKVKLLGTPQGPRVEMVQNFEHQEDLNVIFDAALDSGVINLPMDQNGRFTRQKSPFFYQRNGVLSIFGANSLAQGVYWCDDEQAKSSPHVFYVVSAILPPVKLPEYDSEQRELYSDKCASKDRLFVSHNWRFHYLPQPFRDRTTCETRADDADDCVEMDAMTPIDGCEDVNSGCRRDLVHKRLPDGVKLAVSLRWEPWTPCAAGFQTRQGQCWLQLERGVDASTILSDQWVWLQRLRSLQSASGFRDGVPLFSSLVPSFLYNLPYIFYCDDESIQDDNRKEATQRQKVS